MIFKYKGVDNTGKPALGEIEAPNKDIAIATLLKKDLHIYDIHSNEEKKKIWEINLFAHVSNKEIVILSEQIATLFASQVSALRVFSLLAEEAENPTLGKILSDVTIDLQGGSSISKALSNHPKVFSDFYVNMVKTGEESGRLDQVFSYLAENMDRTYEVTSKAKNALIYPIFVIGTFLGVMILMFTVVIPKISTILTESGQSIPFYTQIILSISNFLVGYWFFFLLVIAVGVFVLSRFMMTEAGKMAVDRLKLDTPYIGDLFKKLYLSRISDNMSTMVQSGITMVRSIEITADIVGNKVYRNILLDSLTAVKSGKTFSDSISGTDRIPGILVQMVRVGEETGEFGSIMQTLAKFYSREVVNAVDTLVNLIEPVMIVFLGVGVGTLLAAIIVPIYNIASMAGA